MFKNKISSRRKRNNYYLLGGYMKEKQTVEKKQKYSKNSIFFIAMTTLMGLSEMFLIALIINNSIILKNYDNYSVHEDFDKVPKEFFIFSIV